MRAATKCSYEEQLRTLHLDEIFSFYWSEDTWFSTQPCSIGTHSLCKKYVDFIRATRLNVFLIYDDYISILSVLQDDISLACNSLLSSLTHNTHFFIFYSFAFPILMNKDWLFMTRENLQLWHLRQKSVNSINSRCSNSKWAFGFVSCTPTIIFHLVYISTPTFRVKLNSENLKREKLYRPSLKGKHV